MKKNKGNLKERENLTIVPDLTIVCLLIASKKENSGISAFIALI